MTRPVTLSEEAFRVLRANKRPGESDSDVILRLAAAGAAEKKDPYLFLRTRLKPAMSWAAHEKFLERMRQADIRRARQLHRGR